ncbi:zinc finger BED domain-containing protein 1-like protein [Aphelenchoides avenae]|nr:zinc finger BED domain-containing protein 1-like protein [Aphelenchus avenae]
MGRQRQHAIWRLNIFEKIDKDSSRCTLCPKPLRTTNNTVGSLVAHLVHHPEEQLKYREMLEQEGTATGPMDEQVVRPSGNLTATDKVVLHWSAVANLPFILVEHPVFRMLFRLFGKAELLHKEKHYRVTILPIVFSRVCARVNAELKKSESPEKGAEPRFKDTLVDHPAAFRQMCLNTLKEVLKDASPDLQHIRDVPRSSSPPRKKSLLANLTNKYARTSAISSSQPVVRQSDIDLEFGVYIREDTVEWEADPLVWWRENSSRFPILSPAAMRFLSTPATSVHSEQIFSAAKLVYNPLRTRLDPKRAEMLIFLHRNLSTIHYHY